MVKLITVEESEKYIPASNTYFISPPTFYTITQDPSQPEWDIITYFTSQLKETFFNTDGSGDSWLFFTSQKSSPGNLRIFSSKRTPDKIIKKLNHISRLDDDYKIEYAVKCFDSTVLKSSLMKFLTIFHNYEKTSKDTFKISIDKLSEMINIINRI